MSGRFQRNHHLVIEHLEQRELLSVNPAGAKTSALAVATDDFGNTFAAAALVSLAEDGSGTRAGKVDKAGDVDMFRFVAPITGRMTIQELVATGSKVDPYVYVYSAKQQLLAQNDDNGSSINSLVQINVVAGTTYYVKAAGYLQTVGAYTVQFDTSVIGDDFANTFAQATKIKLSTSGAGTQAGKIDPAGDVDMFSFVAPVTGKMTIQELAATGSKVDPYLYVYSANQQPLAQDDDGAGGVNSQVRINVTAGTTYYVKAAAYPGTSGAYTLKFSTVTGTVSDYQIDVTMSGMTSSQQQIVLQAVNRWEQIIVGDVPDVVYQGQTIDDIRIDISAVPIDGVDGILGQAGPTAFRSGSYLPYLGMIQLDTYDVAAMQSDGSLLAVIEHEMAHVLGFGTIWDDLGLLSGAGTSNPIFTGAQATAAYNALFNKTAAGVPVEADGGPGTALAHWDETLFNNELMTGYIGAGSNPLSRITIASMADIGYQVNMAVADPYTPPSSSISSARGAGASGVSSVLSSYALSSKANHLADRVQLIDLIFSSHANLLSA